ncbi:MAG: 4Fe-4S binding protein, partial [Methanomicrobiales archaeon]|nr:4Fe-4S binding protein [Methanomicrobiales archaeon]
VRPRPIPLRHVPAPLVHLAGRLLASRPVIRASACSQCGKCAESCPPHAISFVKGRVPRIHHHRCIRCFCCQELCPEGAVEVTYPWIRRVLSP